MHAPDQNLDRLIPSYLRNRPTEVVPLAYYLLSAETGDHPDAHLPDPSGSNCTRCYEKAEDLREMWAGLDYSQMANPTAESEARQLILFWFQSAAMRGSAIVFHSPRIPDFDPNLVPRPEATR